MRKKKRRGWVALPALVALAACGPSPQRAEQTAAAESAAAVAADPALQEAADRAEAEARAASMEGRESCLEKASQVPSPSRAQIEAACRRLPSRPR